MKLNNDFEVPANVDHVWSYLLDVEKVVVCMPGAKLTETVDDDNYKGQLTLKLGPVKLAFAGKVAVQERSQPDHKMVLAGRGTEQKGKGAAQATITVLLSSSDSGGTKVDVEQDLQVSGQVAQLSRGMMQDVSSKLTRQFAECLKANIEAGQNDDAETAEPGESTPSAVTRDADTPESTSTPATQEAARPAPSVATGTASQREPTHTASTPEPAHRAPDEISVASVGAGAMWAAVKRFFARLFGRAKN